MVLQRNADVKIWGWAAPGEKVQVHFLDTVFHTTADESGKWNIILSDLQAGGPFDMKIIASNTITIKDILVGDVWVCSGQSQMDIDMNRVSPLYEEDIKNAGNPYIRYFEVPIVYEFNSPLTDLGHGSWEHITQDSILKVSAIAYFFGNELYNKYKIPIGLIRSSHGGSTAQAWMSEDAIKDFPEYFKELQKYKDTTFLSDVKRTNKEITKTWYTKLGELDKGNKDPDMPWYNPRLDISDWQVMNVPGYWADSWLGQVNGVIWFRKDIVLPDNMAGKPARLNLGRIIDADSAFVNGEYVGSISYQYPPRRYDIPPNLLKAGKNTIVLRVISIEGKGGFVPDKPYELVFEDEKIDLKGDWHYKVGAEMKPMQPMTSLRRIPSGLYNGMIAPIKNYSIKGVIWYQGESNTDKPLEYADLFPALISNWRNKWQQGDFPFIYAQLHNYTESYDQPTESKLALTREAQLHALSLPNTAMAVTVDLGEWNDIHPLDKKDVAKRFVLAAQKIVYNEPGVVPFTNQWKPKVIG